MCTMCCQQLSCTLQVVLWFCHTEYEKHMFLYHVSCLRVVQPEFIATVFFFFFIIHVLCGLLVTSLEWPGSQEQCLLH